VAVPLDARRQAQPSAFLRKRRAIAWSVSAETQGKLSGNGPDEAGVPPVEAPDIKVPEITSDAEQAERP
jgi:hypothetical protein